MSSFSARDSVFRSIYQQSLFDTHRAHSNIKQSAKDSLDYVQRLGLQCKLDVHTGCVNTIHWNNQGEYLLSGSDDQCIAITNPHTQKVRLKYKTAHRANIFSARFMPQSNDEAIVSCSGDGIVLHTELQAPYVKLLNEQSNGRNNGIGAAYAGLDESSLHMFTCHKTASTYEVLTAPMEPHSFMSCGEDCTVRYFDLRQISSCHKTCCRDNILILNPAAANSMDISPISQNQIAVGSCDAVVRIYDRRYLSVLDCSSYTNTPFTRPVKAFTIPMPRQRSYRITCVKYSPDESELLVSYSSEYLYLFDLKHNGMDINELMSKDEQNIENIQAPSSLSPEQITRRLRLRGDWSDTGPDARPEGETRSGQVRPQLHANLMSRMTEVISRLLSDPRTRQGLHRNAGETVEDWISVEPPPSTSSTWRLAASRTLRQQQQQQIRANEQQNVASSEEQKAASTKAAVTDTESGNDSDSSLNSELARQLEFELTDEVFEYIRQKYEGHRNARTMIKEAAFWGSKYVMSGSDCGHIFTWDRRTGKLVKLLLADRHVVNCLQPHPELPYLASSGIDYDIKLWAPILPEANFDKESADDLIKRNVVMLEQTRDTVTVPAAFMIRMLACIHSLRSRERGMNAEQSSDAAGNNENAQNNVSTDGGNSNNANNANNLDNASLNSSASDSQNDDAGDGDIN